MLHWLFQPPTFYSWLRFIVSVRDASSLAMRTGFDIIIRSLKGVEAVSSIRKQSYDQLKKLNMFNFYDCLNQLKTPLRLLTIIWKPALNVLQYWAEKVFA